MTDRDRIHHEQFSLFYKRIRGIHKNIQLNLRLFAEQMRQNTFYYLIKENHH